MIYSPFLVALLSCSVVALPHYSVIDLPSRIASHEKAHKYSTLSPKHFMWRAPGKHDLRSPCPVMNTLANHGFVNHNGRNITRQPFVEGCVEGLNITPEFADNIFTNGLPANPTPNATFFDLDMLHKTHGLIEHDGSLSRKDIFFDPLNPFDPETFENFMGYFGKSKNITVQSIANARARHAYDMSRINPEFEITEESIPVIVGENSMILTIFGDSPENPVAKTAFFDFFFRYERLPVLLGWVPPSIAVGPFIGVINEAIIAQSPPDVPLTFSPGSA